MQPPDGDAEWTGATRLGPLLSERLCDLALLSAPSLLPLPLPATGPRGRKKSEPASKKRSRFSVYSTYVYEETMKCQALLLGVAIGIVKQTQRSLVKGKCRPPDSQLAVFSSHKPLNIQESSEGQ